MGLDRTYHAHQFICSFFFFLHFSFISCGRLSFLLHVKYTVSYRIAPMGQHYKPSPPSVD